MIADKFNSQENTNDLLSVPYLATFNHNIIDFHEENLTILEQKMAYSKLHEIYKKALTKALKNKQICQ